MRGQGGASGRGFSAPEAVGEIVSPTCRPRIAVYHPDPWSLTLLLAALADAGFALAPLPSPDASLRPWRLRAFDLMLLYACSPHQSETQLVSASRDICGSRPLLVMTARDDSADRVAALRHGSDDALFLDRDFSELLARISALLRRRQDYAGHIAVSELQIDLVDRRVARAGRPITLPLREFDLLTNLARTPDCVVPRDRLLRSVWQLDSDPGTNRIEVHMSRLRAKIDRGFDWPMLHTVKGLGYRLVTAPQLSHPT